MVKKPVIQKVLKITGVKGPVQPSPKLEIVDRGDEEMEEEISTMKKLINLSLTGRFKSGEYDKN